MIDKLGLVVGANGIVGKALFEEIERTPGWRGRALSRKPHASADSIACDLSDNEGTRRALEAAKDVTHVFYAAFAPGGGLAGENRVNGAMLRNLLDGLSAVGAPIERVVLYQGAKIYGVHLGPVPTPFYEDDNPRHLGPNFYQTQEDELRHRTLGGGFDWSIIRPDVVIGDAAGNAMNIATVIGAFAALCKATGSAFRFPGSVRVYDHVFAQMTDAHALARASLWAATADATRNEAFNYVHEPFRWRRIWEKVALAFDIELGPPMPLTLAEHMPALESVWDWLAVEQGMTTIPYNRAVGWAFGDFVFKAEFDLVSDMTKIRLAGFAETVDTGKALISAIRRQQTAGTVPAITARRYQAFQN